MSRNQSMCLIRYGAGIFTLLCASPLYAANDTGIWSCFYLSDNTYHYAVFESNLSQSELNGKFAERFPNARKTGGWGCRDRREFGENTVQQVESKWREEAARRYSYQYQRHEWSPDAATLMSARRRKSVFFRAPRSDEGRGFQGVIFDIEYQLIACFGELHLAYSLVKDSVGGKKPAYLFRGPEEDSASWHEVASRPPQVDAVHLKGKVYIPPFHNEPIGTYSDSAAGQSLGFGCFTGQTKKIANLKDHLGDKPTKEKVQALIDKLEVSFQTNDVLTSQAAEAEIREGKARVAAAPKEAHAETDADAGPTAAELRAQRHAEVEARNAAANKKYQEELAKQQQAVADFKAAEDRVAAEKAAQAARAKAVQDEYQRRQAAHAAEMERHRQQQAEYEAQLAAPASVKQPQ